MRFPQLEQTLHDSSIRLLAGPNRGTKRNIFHGKVRLCSLDSRQPNEILDVSSRRRKRGRREQVLLPSTAKQTA